MYLMYLFASFEEERCFCGSARTLCLFCKCNLMLHAQFQLTAWKWKVTCRHSYKMLLAVVSSNKRVIQTKHFYVERTLQLPSNRTCSQPAPLQDSEVRDAYRKSSFFLLKEAMLLALPCCIRVTPRKQGDII